MTDGSSTPPNSVETPPNKGGRPPKLADDEATLAQLEGLGRINCTQREGAAFFHVTEKTFSEFLRDHEKAKAAFEDGRERGKISLRRQQWKRGEAGNVTMLIWLGKQWLGQTDKTDMNHGLTADFAKFLEEIDGDSASLI